MKKAFLFILTSCLIGCSSPEERMIKEYLGEHLNDIESYSPVSFSDVDSLKSTWKLPKDLEDDFNKLLQCVDDINESGYNGIKITADADSYIRDLDKFYDEKYQSIFSSEEEKVNFMKKVKHWKKLWEDFRYYQDIVYGSKESFVPQFIGWKVTHKYRAANSNGAIQLYEFDFYFNKEKSKIVGVHKNDDVNKLEIVEELP